MHLGCFFAQEKAEGVNPSAIPFFACFEKNIFVVTRSYGITRVNSKSNDRSELHQSLLSKT